LAGELVSAEHLAEVEAADSRGSTMSYTTSQGSYSRRELAEHAALEWQDRFETRYEDVEALRLIADGFRVTVTVDGEAFTVEMRPSVIWEAVAVPEPT
jgi:hypothetical protein